MTGGGAVCITDAIMPLTLKQSTLTVHMIKVG